MSYDINSQQIDIENLFKQNENDLASIKELYRKLKELEKKISEFKYIDTKLADKLKKDYEKLKRIILDENIQLQLINKIDEVNIQLDNEINEINSQLDTKTNNLQGQINNLVLATQVSEEVVYNNLFYNSSYPTKSVTTTYAYQAFGTPVPFNIGKYLVYFDFNVNGTINAKINVGMTSDSGTYIGLIE